MPLAALLGVAALTVTACGGDGSAAGSVFKPVKPGVLTVATALLPDALRAVEKRIFRHGFDGRGGRRSTRYTTPSPRRSSRRGRRS